MNLQEIGVPVVEDLLEHYGVRGMHWGVRTRGQVSVGNKVKGKFDKTVTSHPEAQEFSKLRKKKSHELSNEELKKVTQRGELLTKFHRMNPSNLTKGKATVASILALGGTATSMIALYNGPLGQKLRSIGQTIVSKELDRRIKGGGSFG